MGCQAPWGDSLKTFLIIQTPFSKDRLLECFYFLIAFNINIILIIQHIFKMMITCWHSGFCGVARFDVRPEKTKGCFDATQMIQNKTQVIQFKTQRIQNKIGTVQIKTQMKRNLTGRIQWKIWVVQNKTGITQHKTGTIPNQMWIMQYKTIVFNIRSQWNEQCNILYLN